MKPGILLLLFVTLFGCTEDDTSIRPSDLQGEWIDVATQTDTLIFESWDSKDVMLFNRGTEMTNGQLLPKPGSGPYEYELTDNGAISLHWMLSSSYMSSNYFYFEVKGTRLFIENFYDLNSGETLIFEKLD